MDVSLAEDPNTGPIDMRLVLGDDQLICALAAGRSMFTDDELTAMLQAWRDEVREATADQVDRPWLAQSRLAAMRLGVSNALSRLGMDRIKPRERPT